MRRVTLIVVLVALVSTVARAQDAKPAFEVASVKRNISEPGFGGAAVREGANPTGFSAVNWTLRQLITRAYELGDTIFPVMTDRLVTGGPSWVQTQRFDVTARAATEVSPAQVNAMLRTLLEDRFKLVVGTEQRQRDAYVLKLARADGRLGPDVRKARADCDVARRKDPLALSKNMLRPSNAALQQSAGGACTTLDAIAFQIELTLNAAVINETGLTGRWEASALFPIA